jgi:FKBP-type peptidyl-prolyl cis-trans isomerase 2
MAESTGTSPLLAVAIVVIVIGAGLAAGYVYLRDRPAGPTHVLVVAVGDNVTVNYIGIFGSGPEQGKVFDTSLYAVGSNNAAWPKSLEYQGRGASGNYSPLAVHVGGSTPSGGYSLGGLSFIQVVTGFWQGLIGQPGNLTKSVSVPPNLGYGPSNPACQIVRPLAETFPVFETLTRSAFGGEFPGVLPNTGASLIDPHYRWPVLILSANSTSVAIENLASVGATVSPFGYPIVVTNVSSTADGTGSITVVAQLTPNDAGQVLGNDLTGKSPCPSQSNGKFVVTAVDIVHGTFTSDYNTEVTGQTLIFMVQVVNIFVPAPAV